MKRLALAVLAAWLLAASCDPPGPQPQPPGPSGGTGGAATGGSTGTGGVRPTGGTSTGGQEPLDDCDRAQFRLQELNCRRAADGGPRWLTPKGGVPLAIVCRERAADGDSMCPKCIAAVESCDQVDACKAVQPGVCKEAP